MSRGRRCEPLRAPETRRQLALEAPLVLQIAGFGPMSGACARVEAPRGDLRASG
jgi:hypothetical protein